MHPLRICFGFLKVCDQLYPLTADTPVLLANSGIYMFPDSLGETTGSYVGLVLSSELPATDREMFQDLLAQLVDLRIQVSINKMLCFSMHVTSGKTLMQCDQGVFQYLKRNSEDFNMKYSIKTNLKPKEICSLKPLDCGTHPSTSSVLYWGFILFENQKLFYTVWNLSFQHLYITYSTEHYLSGVIFILKGCCVFCHIYCGCSDRVPKRRGEKLLTWVQKFPLVLQMSKLGEQKNHLFLDGVRRWQKESCQVCSSVSLKKME